MAWPCLSAVTWDSPCPSFFQACHPPFWGHSAVCLCLFFLFAVSPHAAFHPSIPCCFILRTVTPLSLHSYPLGHTGGTAFPLTLQPLCGQHNPRDRLSASGESRARNRVVLLLRFRVSADDEQQGAGHLLVALWGPCGGEERRPWAPLVSAPRAHSCKPKCGGPGWAREPESVGHRVGAPGSWGK